MHGLITLWGASLGLRLPKSFAERAGIRVGDQVEIEAEGDALFWRSSTPRYALADLLVGMTPQAAHAAFSWDDLGVW